MLAVGIAVLWDVKLHKSCVIAMWQIPYSISEYPYIYRISGHGYTSMWVQTGRQGWHNLVIPQLLFSEKVKNFKGKLLPFRQNRRPILYPNILLNLKFSVLRRSRELARCNASGPFGAWFDINLWFVELEGGRVTFPCHLRLVEINCRNLPLS